MKCIHVDHQTLHKLSQGADKKAYYGLKNSVIVWYISINFVNTCLNLHFLILPQPHSWQML